MKNDDLSNSTAIIRKFLTEIDGGHNKAIAWVEKATGEQYTNSWVAIAMLKDEQLRGLGNAMQKAWEKQFEQMSINRND